MNYDAHLLLSSVGVPLVGANQNYSVNRGMSNDTVSFDTCQGGLVELGEKLKLIRAAEDLSQEAFARELEMNTGTYRQIESGRRSDPKLSSVEKITNHEQFKKYTLWLMNGDVIPEAGQISPEIEQQRTA